MIEMYQNFYKEAKEKYGDKIVVLMQVGKFFEMYDSCPITSGQGQTNIREASALLEISVSETPISVKKGLPTHNKLFSGFPDYVVKKYERILIRQGYRGVFITQEKEGKTYKRDVSNIVSAGTFAEDEAEYSTPVLDRWLWAFFCEQATEEMLIHSAAISCATGKIIVGNTMVGTTGDDIYLALSTYEPAEVIVWSTEEKLDATTLREMFHLPYNIPLHIRTYEHKKGAVKAEEDILLRSFSLERALLFSELQIDRKPDTRRVLAHLLAFVEEHNPALIKNLKLPTDFQASEYVRLGNHTLEQVGMINKNKDKQNECFFHYFNKVHTACGRRALRQRLLQPIKDVSVLRERVAIIDKWRDCAGKLDVVAGLKKVYDIEKLFRRIQLKSASVADVWKLLSSLISVEEVIKGTEIAGFPETEDTKAIRVLIKEIQQKWDLVKLAQVRDAKEVECVNPWPTSVSETLNSFESGWKEANAKYTSILAECRTIVPDGFQPTREDDRPFAVYGTKTRCDKVLKAKVLTPTLRMEDIKGHYYLRSDEIDALNTCGLKTLKCWEKEWAIIWSNKLDELATELLSVFPQIVGFVAETDINLNLAERAEEYGYCSPVYEEGDHSGLFAEGLRHGILERIRRDIMYVPHTVALGSLATAIEGEESLVAKAEGGILLFGVNSSGKSSLMKSIGLSVLLAQAGCPVPATQFKIVPYASIFTRILGNDNLWAGMSSFVVEMTEFRNILEYADQQSLVLGDELCAGTETSSAAALVAAGLECLLEKRASFFFATHLHELQRFPELLTKAGLKWLHLRVRFDPTNGQLVYDRDLQEGCGEMNYGLEVCRALRMPPSFLEKATAFRRRLQGLAPSALAQPASRYNSSVIRRACSVCGKEGSKELEVHHIIHQEKAKKGKVAPGVSKNHAGNLAVLCEECHTKHHTGQIEIIGWKETSAGKMLITS